MESPQTLLAVSVLCAETEEKAGQLRKLADYTLLQFEKGNFREMSRYEDIKDYIFSEPELERIRYNQGRIISGTPAQVGNALTALASDTGVDELMITTLTHSHIDRVRSFELIAKTIGLVNN